MTLTPPFIVGALVGVGFLLGMLAGIALDERDRIYNPIRDMAWTLGAVVVALVIVLCCPGCATVEGWIDEEGIEDVVDVPDDEEPDTEDAVAFDKLRWTRGGTSHAGAARDAAACITGHVSGNTLYYSGTGLEDWPEWRMRDNSPVTHMWSMFFDENGDGVYERGGKFDWGRRSYLQRPLHHIDHGYSNWDGYPAAGTPWAAVATSVDGGKRCNVIGGVW